jgi:peptide/nickel transport system permease protein
MMGEGGYVSEGEMEQLRSEFNLDKPLHEQLYLFLANGIRGDLGYSYVRKAPVTLLIRQRLPATVEMAIGALLVALLIATPVGIISAIKQNSATDRLAMAGTLVGVSLPGFWFGIILILIVSVKLRWLPVAGRIDLDAGLETVTGFYVLDSILTGNRAALISSIRHLILPSLALGIGGAAVLARVLRSSMLEVLRQDYIMLARAKGQSEFQVIMRHALRNALIPTVTLVGLQVGNLLGGNMLVETIFGWPGLGRLVVDAIFARDFPLVQGAVMMYAFIFVTANLVVDLMYTVLNPKISL